MSPSPISSLRTTSGSSTPLTGGSGALPFNQLKQSVYLQESLGSMPKPSNSIYINGLSYHDSNPDLFRGMQPGTHIFSELVPSENDVLGKQLGRPIHGELYDGQSIFADHVSRRLSRDHAKMNPSLDLSPHSPLPTRTSAEETNVCNKCLGRKLCSKVKDQRSAPDKHGWGWMDSGSALQSRQSAP